MDYKGDMSTGNSKNRPAGAGDDGPGEPEGLPALDGPTLGGPTSGRVKFDARGNAIWEWAVTTGAFGREVSTERLKRLENDALSLAEDAPTPADHVKANPLGVVKGYNPYDSGKLGKTRQAPKKTDLRKLSEWLKLKKQAANNKDDE
jgi:hypothetical protein